MSKVGREAFNIPSRRAEPSLLNLNPSFLTPQPSTLNLLFFFALFRSFALSLSRSAASISEVPGGGSKEHQLLHLLVPGP